MKIKCEIGSALTTAFLIIVLSGLLVEGGKTNDKVYIVVLIYAVLMGLYIVTKKRFIILHNYLFGIPAITIMVWVYGIIVGLLNGNRRDYLIRNFAGITVYIIFYLLYWSGKSVKEMLDIALKMAVFIAGLTLVAYLDMFVWGRRVFMTLPLLKNFNTSLTILYAARELIYIAYVYYAVQIVFFRQYRLRNFLIVALCVIVEMVCIRSDGDKLALLLFTALVIWKLVINRMKKRDVLIFTLVGGSLLIVLMFPLVRSFFDPSDPSNAERYEQIEYLLQNINFLGKGLGATFTNNIGSGYAVETTYLDIFHKFGVFAVVILAGYVITLIEALKLFLNRDGNEYDVIPLAYMGYLLPALGNPILFSSISVVSHCIALLYIIERKKSNEAENAANRHKLL